MLGKRHILTGAGILLLGAGGHFAVPDSPVGSLIETLKIEEAFRSKPYRDTRGVLTIGYGTNIQRGITPTEGEWLLRERLRKTEQDLAASWPSYYTLPSDVQAAVLDMAYQLGVHGLMEFHQMLSALIREDYATAIKEAEDSAWARETPTRVGRVVKVFKGYMRCSGS